MNKIEQQENIHVRINKQFNDWFYCQLYRRLRVQLWQQHQYQLTRRLDNQLSDQLRHCFWDNNE